VSLRPQRGVKPPGRLRTEIRELPGQLGQRNLLPKYVRQFPDLVPGYCQSSLQNNPPCTNPCPDGGPVPVGVPGFNAARSYQAGGVNTLLADGSVRFAKDSVNSSVWQSLSTTQGGEVLSADSY